MISTVQIDWREWRDWSKSPDGVIAKLNNLLRSHGVRIEKLSDDSCDFLDLGAFSFGISRQPPRLENEIQSGASLHKETSPHSSPDSVAVPPGSCQG